jgi:hypothetical protein
MYDLEGSNDVDPLETPYTGSTLDLIHGQVHPFHGIEQGSLLLEINLTSIYPTCAQGPRDPPVLVHCAHAHANPGGFHLSFLFIGMCGPPPMITFTCIPNLKKNGWVEENFIYLHQT